MTMITAFLERSVPRPRTVKLTVIARDPSVLDTRVNEKRILRAEVDVPLSRLDPGPRGPRFHVVDFDSTRHRLRPPATMTDPADPWTMIDNYAKRADTALLTDPGFRAQNVYAIATRTLATFEFALGRPVPWGFNSSQLYLVPAAFAEANAFYADTDQALYFGYLPDSDGNPAVLTSLAHDIVVHETTHAILDGLRRRFDVPAMPDQAGFHEGFSDIVALLSLLALRETLESLIAEGSEPTLTAAQVSERALRKSVLFTIGQEFGDTIHETRGGGLRRSVEQMPTTEWRDATKREWQEPHRRGEILVAAVMQSFLEMWRKRLVPITHGSVDRARAAEEGARAAQHLLEMCIRAIDYCPPVDFTFEDFLAAVDASDSEVSPVDDFHYRDALTSAFGKFGIVAPPRTDTHISDDQSPSYRSFSYAALRSDPDEAFRFLWENAGLLNIDSQYYLHVENVRPSVRVGPRGFVVPETVVDYVQELILSRDDFDRLGAQYGVSAPPEIPGPTQLKLWGGGAIVFDEFGSLKYHHAKPLADWRRQADRLKYLVERGQWDTKGRIGFAFAAPPGQRFAVFHTSGESAAEEW